MSQEIGVALDEYETEEFLKERGLGVLGLSKGGETYTIPIAFAYDDDGGRFVFRFIMTEESMKRKFLSETDIASLTAYEWKSVVA